ncbi:hypothetical protein HI914_01153 [Erysiphe necator]|nr:hypothetical protein HI914_01153 [Erysiphe necator]
MGPDLYFNTSYLLPDLKAQIASYLTSTTTVATSGITFFIFSIGFWDIYSLASLSLDVSQVAINLCFEEILQHIRRLYEKNHSADRNLGATLKTNQWQDIRVIIPKVLDPTFSPGWLSQRPVPPKPSTIAEQQKNAVYLTERWNQKLEALSSSWVTTQSSIFPENFQVNKTLNDVNNSIFIPDFPKLFQNLTLDNLTLKSINEPCVQLKTSNERHGLKIFDPKNLNICSHPDEYLWWDAWRIGAVGNAILGDARITVP